MQLSKCIGIKILSTFKLKQILSKFLLLLQTAHLNEIEVKNLPAYSDHSYLPGMKHSRWAVTSPDRDAGRETAPAGGKTGIQ